MQVTINSKVFKSVKEPTMGHLFMSTELQEINARQVNGEPIDSQEYLDFMLNLRELVLSAFPTMTREDFNAMPKSQFGTLIGRIIVWANGGKSTQKKT